MPCKFVDSYPVPRSLRKLLPLLFLLFFPTLSTGTVITGPIPSLRTYTIEALAIDSHLVAIATILPTEINQPPNTLRFSVTETFKPQSSSTSSSTVFLKPFQIPDPSRFPSPGTRVLIFASAFSSSGTPSPTNSPTLYDLIPLSQPTTPAHSLVSPTVKDVTLTPITTPAAALDLVRAELRRSPPIRDVILDYNSDNQFPPLVLPDDPFRLRLRALQWAHSSDPQLRYLAIQVFKAHRRLAQSQNLNAREPLPDQSEYNALNLLLSDPYIAIPNNALNPWTHRQYPLRRLAYNELVARRYKVSEPQTQSSIPDVYSKPSLFWLLLPLLPYIIFALARYRLGVSSSLTRTLYAYFIFTSLLAASLTLLLHLRSLHTADDLVYARDKTLLQLTSMQGALLIRLSSNFPLETPLAHLSIMPSQDSPFSQFAYFQNSTRHTPDAIPLYSLYNDPRYNTPPPLLFSRHQISPSRVTPTASPFSPYPFSFVQLPYRYLYLPLTLIPLLHFLTAFLFTHLRRRHRLARQLCTTCAYPLHVLPPDSCCPECGTKPPTRKDTQFTLQTPNR